MCLKYNILHIMRRVQTKIIVYNRMISIGTYRNTKLFGIIGSTFLLSTEQ